MKVEFEKNSLTLSPEIKKSFIAKAKITLKSQGDKNSRPGLYEFSTSFLDDIIKNGLGDELRTEMKKTSR